MITIIKLLQFPNSFDSILIISARITSVMDFDFENRTLAKNKKTITATRIDFEIETFSSTEKICT